MDDILPCRGDRLDNEISLPVVLLEDRYGRHFPRLIDRLQSHDGWVVLVPLGNDPDRVETVHYVCPVDAGVGVAVHIVGSEPMGRTDRPVLKGDQSGGVHGQVGRPLDQHGPTRVVKAVLGTDMTMNVNQDFNAAGVGPVEKLVDVCSTAVHATNWRERERERERDTEQETKNEVSPRRICG